MGKTEKGTPKDVSNRMKAKGLQKLRWYCQMCEKQCRDENGFKCHTMSESHQRQLLLFADNPDKYLDSFSNEFMEGYLNLLKRRFGTKRVHANNVYQEYIQDKDHVHMNATQWETLTDFVKWIGREGHCIVDETEKGWFVTYIDRDPETIHRQKQLARRDKFEKDEKDRFEKFINKQVELGKQREKVKKSEEFSEFIRENESDTISISMNKVSVKKDLAAPEGKTGNPLISSAAATMKPKIRSELKKRSVLDELMHEDQKRMKHRYDLEKPAKPSSSTSDIPWLNKDIVVKVITKDLGSKYYKEKGVVLEVIDQYCALVKLLECGTKIKLDQSHLETVIPNINREVLILQGEYKGQKAILKKILVDKFSGNLEIISAKHKHIIAENTPYEHFSKYKPS